MATMIGKMNSLGDRLARERAFFLVMAIAIAATVVLGFALQFVAGRSSFGAPWWVHVHGLTFMGWLALYLAQNWLVWRGDLVGHMRLGRVAAGYVVWMVPVGIGATMLSAMNHRVPSFFRLSEFLVMDWLTITIFAGLVTAAVRMRGASDWHKRLMLSAVILLMGPGLGRLIPMPLLGWWMFWSVWAGMLPFMAAALIFDWRTRGRMHHAYIWGFGLNTVSVALIHPIAATAPMLLVARYLAG